MHRACLADILELKNQCPLCDKTILDGYQTCLTSVKIKENKVTKVIATKKKKSARENLDDALRKQAEKNVMEQFGINGSGIG